MDAWGKSNKAKTKEKIKHKRKKFFIDPGMLFFIAMVIVILVGIGYCMFSYLQGVAWFEKELEYVDTLDWEPENATVTYSMNHAKPHRNNWINFYCWIEYDTEPWNDTQGYFWYNHDSQWYFEIDVDEVDTSDEDDYNPYTDPNNPLCPWNPNNQLWEDDW